MPKIIIDNWLGGQANNDRIGNENQYAVGRDIDIHRDIGYLMPGYTGTALTSVDQLASLVVDFTVRPVGTGPSTPQGYAIETGKLHQINLGTDTISTTSPFPYSLPTGKDGKGIFFFDSTAQRNAIYYVLEDNIGKETNGTFDDDWWSTIPAGSPATLNAFVEHPYLIWNNYFWIGNYNKIAKFDGETGANGTVTMAALTLPTQWEITSLFDTPNYIGICVTLAYEASGIITLSRYATKSFVVLWDGVSSTYNQIIPISDNRITSSYNHNGIIYLFTENRDLSGALYILQDNGGKKLERLRTDVGNAWVNLTAPKIHSVESYNNKILFGGGNYDLVMAHGSVDNNTPIAFFQPFSNTSTSGGITGAIKVVDTDKIYISTQVSTTYTIKKYTTGNSTSAVYKGLYKDFGQKVRINYVKFYFKALVSGDSITPTLDADYGTSWTLKDPRGNTTIAFANDGAITSKRFNVHRNCHSVRPTLSWTAGGTAFSKIVIDYDFIEDT